MKPTGPLACMAILVSSCAMGPTYVEQDFGRSVRQMVEGQISNPEAAINPSPEHSGLLDGVAAEESLIGYRKSGQRQDGAQREIRLSVD